MQYIDGYDNIFKLILLTYTVIPNDIYNNVTF